MGEVSRMSLLELPTFAAANIAEAETSSIQLSASSGLLTLATQNVSADTPPWQKHFHYSNLNFKDQSQSQSQITDSSSPESLFKDQSQNQSQCQTQNQSPSQSQSLIVSDRARARASDLIPHNASSESLLKVRFDSQLRMSSKSDY